MTPEEALAWVDKMLAEYRETLPESERSAFEEKQATAIFILRFALE